MRSTIALLVLSQLACISWASRSDALSQNIQFYVVTTGQRAVTATRYLGDKTAIHIDGLVPNSIYTVRASLNFGTQNQNSSATMQSDSLGVIDTDSTPSNSGSYSGIDVDGLFWSMTVDPTPIAQAPSVYRISIEQSGKEIQSANLANGFLKPGVQQISLEGTGLAGTLFLPNTDKPLPAVITYSGSEGGALTGVINAASLANEGFVALGVGYFGAPGLPGELANIPLEYFQKAIQVLQARPEVQGDKIAVMGPSRGGELSLLLGATFPEIKAVVAMVPSPIRWGANDASAGTDHPNPAWTLHGVGLTFLDSVGDLIPSLTLPNGQIAYSNRPAFEKGMQDQVGANKAMSEIEKTNGPILLLGADDDQVWPSCVLAEIAMKRLREKAHKFNDQVVCYPNAGHMGVGVPGLSTMTSNVVWHAQMKAWLNLGGTPSGNASAQRQSWTTILEFLKNNLK